MTLEYGLYSLRRNKGFIPLIFAKPAPTTQLSASKCITAAIAWQGCYNNRIYIIRPMSNEEMKTGVGAELERLNKVLEVAKRNGNQIFIENIEREIAAIKRGENSPLIADYLTDDERAGSRPGREA
jgi:hypothetical protein